MKENFFDVWVIIILKVNWMSINRDLEIKKSALVRWLVFVLRCVHLPCIELTATANSITCTGRCSKNSGVFHSFAFPSRYVAAQNSSSYKVTIRISNRCYYIVKNFKEMYGSPAYTATTRRLLHWVVHCTK